MNTILDPTELQLYDPDLVRQSLEALLPAGQTTELRILEAITYADRWPHTAIGYFDDSEKLIEALATVRSAKGIYTVVNPVNSALIARSANRLRKAGKGEATTDNDILRRYWLLIDCDPVRPEGISSTDEEHEAAIERTRSIYTDLHYNFGWPEPIAADSGNGSHLLYRVDLPVADEGLLQRCLAALAAKYDNEPVVDDESIVLDAKVVVDQKVFNPARIWKLYGTRSCKGDSVPDRPHRLSKILNIPSSIIPVTVDQLQALAGEAPVAVVNHDQPVVNGKLHLDEFIQRHGLELDGPVSYQSGRKWTFRFSPLCDHHDDGPFLIEFGNGALSAGCHHNSCNWSWHDLRQKLEPNRPENDILDRLIAKAASSTPSISTPIDNSISTTIDEAIRFVPFPTGTLPDPLPVFIRNVAKAVDVDDTLVAVPLLVALTAAIGNSRCASPQAGWNEPMTLWAAVVLVSGGGKTPAASHVLKATRDRDEQAQELNALSLTQFKQDKLAFEADLAEWKKQKDRSDPPPEPPEPPKLLRFSVQDITLEKLIEVLSHNPRGVLKVHDELAGLFGGFDRYNSGKASERSAYLSIHNAEPIRMDRRTTDPPSLYVARPHVSIFGGIQPDLLSKVIESDDLSAGLPARFLFAMPPERPRRWTKETVSEVHAARVAKLFEKLYEFQPERTDSGKIKSVVMPLTTEAESIFASFYDEHHRQGVDLSGPVRFAWPKLVAYAARLGSVLHCVRLAAGDTTAHLQRIDDVSISTAIGLVKWFAHEATRVYGLFTENPVDRGVRELIGWIERRGGSVTPRDLQSGNRKYREAGVAEKALADLVSAGYGDWEIEDEAGRKGGRPTRRFMLTTMSASAQLNKSRDLESYVDADIVDNSENELSGSNPCGQEWTPDQHVDLPDDDLVDQGDEEAIIL